MQALIGPFIPNSLMILVASTKELDGYPLGINFFIWCASNPYERSATGNPLAVFPNAIGAVLSLLTAHLCQLKPHLPFQLFIKSRIKSCNFLVTKIRLLKSCNAFHSLCVKLLFPIIFFGVYFARKHNKEYMKSRKLDSVCVTA